jgi:hypothetical protein
MASPSSAPPEHEQVTTQEKARAHFHRRCPTPACPADPTPPSLPQLIEEKEERLQKLLDMNRAKLADMEQELLVLRRDLKLTSAPKKAALEMLRMRIEEASERVRTARSARAAAAAALTAADSRLAAEEAGKAQLVRDMHMLIHQSTQQQMQALEALQTRMDSLVAQVPGSLATAPMDASPAEAAELKAARAELEAAAVVSAGDEARQRHVALPHPGASSAREHSEQRAPGPRPPPTLAVTLQPRALTGSSGSFSGFSV